MGPIFLGMVAMMGPNLLRVMASDGTNIAGDDGNAATFSSIFLFCFTDNVPHNRW